MIDIENKVIDTVSEAFSGVAKVSSTFTKSPDEFPWVYIRETDNSAYSWSYDNRLSEHHASVMYRIEYYSSLRGGAKQQVKQLMQIGDAAMQGMKFSRVSSGIIPNWDRAITRGYADYTAVVGEPRTVGNDTVFQMYR